MHSMRCDERKRNQQYLMAATGDSTQLNSLQEEKKKENTSNAGSGPVKWSSIA